MAPEQKKAAQEMIGDVQKAIPWTIFDVIGLQQSNDPKATLGSLMKKPDEAAAGAASGGGMPPASAFVLPDGKPTNQVRGPDGTIYRLNPDGSVTAQPK